MLVLLGAAIVGTPAAFAPPAAAAGPTLQISNFRFCIDPRPIPCDPLDIGYVPNPTTGAPLAPVYSPITTATVNPGDVVTWVYKDAFCDAITGCPGHNVTLTDGTVVGMAAARSGATTIEYTVPLDAAPGSVIPYFCSVANAHYKFGMTGALEVAGGY
jgi:plastocyanin